MKSWLASGCALAAWFAMAGSWAGAAYPAQPVSLVVAGPPGGGTDAVARLLAAELAPRLGQSVIVENRPGAGGIIGTRAVVTAKPDGHTLLMGQVATNAIVPALIQPQPYHAVQDFAPIALVASAPDVLVVPAASGIEDIGQLLEQARASGKPLTYGSPGIGLPQHIAGFALARATGIPMQHVPYRGSAPALSDLLGGQIAMMFVTPGAVVSHLGAGQLRALAVTSAERSRFFPDVPSVVELGFPEVEETGWFGVFAPAGTPASIVERLNREIGEIIETPAVSSRLEALFLEPSRAESPEWFAGYVRDEADKWADIVQTLGVTAE